MQMQAQAFQAQAINNISMASERQARKQSDLALATERIAESEENRAMAALHRAKTITEIAALNDDRILKVWEFVNMLNRQEIEDRERIGAKVEVQSEKIDSDLRNQLQPVDMQQNAYSPILGGQ
jgi:hypothetical protein